MTGTNQTFNACWQRRLECDVIIKFEIRKFEIAVHCAKTIDKRPYVHSDLNARQYAFNPRRQSARIDKGRQSGDGKCVLRFFSPQKIVRASSPREGILPSLSRVAFPCLFERGSEVRPRQRKTSLFQRGALLIRKFKHIKRRNSYTREILCIFYIESFFLP